MTRAVICIRDNKTSRSKLYSAPVTVLESLKERMYTDMLIHKNVERSVEWLNKLVNHGPFCPDMVDRPVRAIPMEVPYDLYLDMGESVRGWDKMIRGWDQTLKECKNRIQ